MTRMTMPSLLSQFARSLSSREGGCFLEEVACENSSGVEPKRGTNGGTRGGVGGTDAVQLACFGPVAVPAAASAGMVGAPVRALSCVWLLAISFRRLAGTSAETCAAFGMGPVDEASFSSLPLLT